MSIAKEEIYFRDEPGREPRSRLIAIADIVDKIREASDGLTMTEITEVLASVGNGDVMIYDGSCEGLCPAIDGDPRKENHGWNLRADLFCEFLNTRYWRNGKETVSAGKERLDIQDLMVRKEEGEKLAQAIWRYFYPTDPDRDFGMNGTGVPSVLAVLPSDSIERCPGADLKISGPTFERLRRAIAAFPVRYPDYESKSPKLNDDVRLWLHESGLVKDGQYGREAHIFGKMITEHFKL